MLYMVISLFVCLLIGGVPHAAWADGAVYAMTNALGNNEIVVFRRASDGTLTFLQRIGTGGGGSGIQLDPTDSLGSQGGLVFDPVHRRLFAVNTESLAEDEVDVGRRKPFDPEQMAMREGRGGGHLEPRSRA